MNRHDFDIIFCHWPLLTLVTRFVPLNQLLRIEDSTFGSTLNLVFGVVLLISAIYGMYRVTTIGIKGGNLFWWVLGILFLPFISLPYLFWSRLWELRNSPPQA